MKSACVCGLTPFYILHFPFSIHHNRSPFIGFPDFSHKQMLSNIKEE